MKSRNNHIEFVLFLVAVVLAEVQAECQTSLQEATWNFVPGRDSSHFAISSVESCQELCSSHPDCLGYTWRFDDIAGWCFEFEKLEDLHACAGCYSGTVPVNVNGACASSPDNLISAVSSKSVDECYQACLVTNGCEAYSWYDQTSSFPLLCFQFTDCSSVIPCEGCSSGQVNCIEESLTTAQPSTLPLHTTTVMQIPFQCSDYKVLNEASRNENNDEFQYYCDKENDSGNPRPSPNWRGSGYYRLEEPAGVRIPTKPPSGKHCGTNFSGWIKDDGGAIQKMQIGQEITLQGCFVWENDPCNHKNFITITRCPGDYYVYKLYETVCYARYCGTINN